MSSNAYLSFYDPETRKLSGPELEAKAAVPLLWLALFEPTHVTHELSTQWDWQTQPSEQGVALVVDRVDATARFLRRRPAIVKFCGEAHGKLIDKLARTISRGTGPQVIVRLDSLAALHDPGVFEREVISAITTLACLDTGTGSPDDNPIVGRVAALDHRWRTNVDVAIILAGNWPAAKPRAAPRDLRLDKAKVDQPRSAFKPYAGTTQFEIGELVEHPTLGDGLVIRIVDASKIEILFQAGARTLIHRRGMDVASPPPQK